MTVPFLCYEILMTARSRLLNTMDCCTHQCTSPHSLKGPDWTRLVFAYLLTFNRKSQVWCVLMYSTDSHLVAYVEVSETLPLE